VRGEGHKALSSFNAARKPGEKKKRGRGGGESAEKGKKAKEKKKEEESLRTSNTH